MVYWEEIPQIVKRVRGKLGISQAEFGRLVGVTAQTVRLWEYGRYIPNSDQIDLIQKLGSIENPPERDNLKKALITGGVALGLFLLLREVFKDKE